MAAPKQPQDHLAKATAETEKEPFFFTGDDGKEYELPTFNVGDAGLSAGFIRKNRKNDAELVYTILEALAPEDSLDALDAMTPEGFGKIVQAWQEAAGASLPKS